MEYEYVNLISDEEEGGDGCEGECTGTCKGTCSDSCSGGCSNDCASGCAQSCANDCTDECQYTCLGTCDNGCFNSCSDECARTCSQSCANNCVDSCDGTCSTTCEGGCLNDCAITCAQDCANDCSGTCSDTCAGTCENTCENTCSGGCQGGCGEGCAYTCDGTCLDGCTGECKSGCYNSCTGNCFAGCSTTCYTGCNGGCVGTCTGTCVGVCTGKCENYCENLGQTFCEVVQTYVQNNNTNELISDDARQYAGGTPFSWSTNIKSGETIIVKAVDWNNLIDKIRAAYAYCSYSDSFHQADKVSATDIISADIYNDLLSSLALINSSATGEKTSDISIITASSFTNLSSWFNTAQVKPGIPNPDECERKQGGCCQEGQIKEFPTQTHKVCESGQLGITCKNGQSAPDSSCKWEESPLP